MKENSVGLLFSLAPFICIALFAWWVYRVLRLRAEHRPRVIKTQLGETTAKAYDLHPARLRVFQLADPRTASAHVGLEVLIPTLSDYQKTSLTLTHAEAKDLIVLVEQALAGRESANTSLQATHETRAPEA